MNDFSFFRRQPFIDEATFHRTFDFFQSQGARYDVRINDPATSPRGRREFLSMKADDHWRLFQLRYTAGVAISELAHEFEAVVSAYQLAVQASEMLSDDDFSPQFVLTSMIDVYTEYLHLACTAVLLHREDLIPTIVKWNRGTVFDESDAIIEELFNFYFDDRPAPEEVLWRPYLKLLEVIDEDTSVGRERKMTKYVKTWYSGMKGKAAFWDSHTREENGVTPYFGYWAICAAAFTYLYDIDDSSYRNELVYPHDLVDYARATPRLAASTPHGNAALRVLGGQTCPVDGTWFSPVKGAQLIHFKAGDVLPNFADAEYGYTIWQLKNDA